MRLGRTATRVAVASTALGILWALPARAQFFTPSETPPPARYIVGRMGLQMSESNARHGVAFRPFAPPRKIVGVALLPPFHGNDERANRGIGFEYVDDADRLYAFAQWPANGGNVERMAPLTGGEPSCPDARTFARGAKPSGIVWSTPHGFIMTLQADGKNDARTLRTEWRKLILRGACR